MRTKGEAATAAAKAIDIYRRHLWEFEQESIRLREEIEHYRSLQTSWIEPLGRWLLENFPLEEIDRLCSTRLREMQQQLENTRGTWQSRLQELDQDSSFQARSQLSQEWSAALTELTQRQSQIDQALEPYESNSDLSWLLARQSQPQPGLFQRFWQSITLAKAREQQAKRRACLALQHSDWEDFCRTYQGLVEQSRDCGNAKLEIQNQQEALAAKLRLYQEAQDWTLRFGQTSGQQMQEKLLRSLLQADYRQLFRQLPAPSRGQAAWLDALQQKIHYSLKILEQFQSLSNDRHQRISKLSLTKHAWKKRPYERLAKNQVPWLITAPQAKDQATQKLLANLRALLGPIRAFNDYAAYQRYLERDPDLFALDVFGYCHPQSLPYEGFLREVLPELTQARQQRQQAKADYRPFKEADKEARKAKPPEEECDIPDEVEVDISYDSDDSSYAPAEMAMAGAVGIAAAETIHQDLQSQLSETS